jgi:methionyl-tRNA formyltransferase
MMGDSKTGLTIFRPDGGIDTGPILLQKEVPIGPEDTTGSLYFNQLFPMGVDAILESIEQIKTGSAPRMIQDESLATYEPPCDDRVAKINLARSGQDIFNLIRGCDPQPGAYCTFKDQQIRFYGVRFKPERQEGESGEVLGLHQDRLAVSTGDGVLEILKVKVPGMGKVKASDFVTDSGIKGGERFE